jgi:5-methylthioadenosine/S-adenosylhomocysteine deaminase
MNKQKADCIVRAEYLLPMDVHLSVMTDGAVAICGGKIACLGKYEEVAAQYDSPTVMGGRGRVILPGLINTHTHAAMVYFRGLADDLPLKEWLEHHIWPAESQWLSPEFVADAVELACLEMVKAGITTYNDMYFFGDAAGRATKKVGIRAVLGAGIVDFPTVAAKTVDEYLGKAGDFIEHWKGDALITPCIAPHSLYACSTETLKEAQRLAGHHKVPVHIHLAETQWEVREIISRFGKRPVQYLKDIGFLEHSVLAAHCVWVEEDEIQLLARYGVGVSHCVESNLKLASGIAPVVRMLDAGVKVTFGTDSAASNNDLNIFSELSTAAKLHKAVSGDPTALDAKKALLMATRWGAEVLGLGGITGSIEEGKSADLVVVNLEKPHLTPIYDIYSHMAYSVRASDVESVMVGGKAILKERQFCCGDESGIMAKARQWAEKIGKDRQIRNAHE